MQPGSNSVSTEAPKSSKYPQDDAHALALERAVTSAHNQYTYFQAEGTADKRLENGEICVIARWAHKMTDPEQNDDVNESVDAKYEDLLSCAGFAHPKKAGGPATKKDLKGLSMSHAWANVFLETLKGDPLYQAASEEGGPERYSLYCSGATLPDELMEKLSRLSDEDWHRTADLDIEPYFRREDGSFENSSQRRPLTARVASWISRRTEDLGSIFRPSRR